MKVTQILWRQHIGRMTKRHWWVKSKQIMKPPPMEDLVLAHGIKVVDAKDVVPPAKMNEPRVEVESLFPRPIPRDNTHPDWNEQPRLRYDDTNVLLDGVAQAQVLLKTERINGLPDKLTTHEDELNTDIENLITRLIYSSHIFDAHQEKLPRIKDPLRPAFKFPRVYGIPNARKTRNLTQKFIQLCELLSDPLISSQRKLIEDACVLTYIERGNDLLYLKSSFDTMIASSKLLTPMSTKTDDFEQPLPNIYPLAPTISLVPENIYIVEDHFPIGMEALWPYPHTIVVHFNSETVKNVTELPVTEDQIQARSIVKAFATAACCAKLKFGAYATNLPEPITVQCIHTNSKWFDFSAFQLNTLDIANDQGMRNIWWSAPRMNLFERAEYVSGRPTVEGYNPEVFKHFLSFYRNV